MDQLPELMRALDWFGTNVLRAPFKLEARGDELAIVFDRRHAGDIARALRNEELRVWPEPAQDPPEAPDGKTVPSGPPSGVSEALVMTEEEFWMIVEESGWGRTSTDPTEIKNAIRVRLNFDVDRIEAFHGIYRDKLGDVYQALDTIGGLGLGDDGFGDLCAHIVGLGKAEYDAVIADPLKGAARARAPYGTPEGFTESFSYAVPSKFDMDEIEWLHYVEWAERVQKEYERAATHEYAAPISAECGRIADALAHVVKKEKEEFFACETQVRKDLETIEEFHKKVSLHDLDIDNPYAVTNLFSDLKSFGPYLR